MPRITTEQHAYQLLQLAGTSMRPGRNAPDNPIAGSRCGAANCADFNEAGAKCPG